MTAHPVLAIDVGGTTIKGEVVDGDGEVLASGTAATPRGDAALGAVADLGRQLVRAAGAAVSRAGVVVPGIVDRARRVGVMSANIGWRDLDLGLPLEAAWDVPVLVDHDVTVAGWAEWRAGAGRGCDDLLFVALGTGIASATVAGGRLLRGGLGQGGELGHVVVRPDGPLCGCGARGCLEAVSSASSITHRYGVLSGRQVGGAGDVIGAISDDPLAVQVWDEAVAALADGLAAVIHLLSPARVVLGGGLAEAGDALAVPLRDAVSDRVRIVPLPDIRLAEFGARSALVGAALLARRGGVED